jgi:uncharacterized protein YecT (DUF1311 family)
MTARRAPSTTGLPTQGFASNPGRHPGAHRGGWAAAWAGLGWALALALPLHQPQAASFDCAKAASQVEIMLCGDPKLGSLDERMARAYREARDRARRGGDTALERLTAEQRAWLGHRDRCSTRACLERLYGERIALLAPGTVGAQGQALESGQLADSGPHYSIHAAYPVLPAGDPAAETGNREIRGLVDSLVEPFRRELAEYQRDGHEGADWSLEIDYGPPRRTGRLLAIPFSGYSYTGGAHGMPIDEPLILDSKDGRRIPPAGLFAPGADWLGALSERCRQALRGRDLLVEDPDWLARGTAPEPDNYQAILPGPDGLTLTFPPYAVAPYAAGPQEVEIPYGELGGVLNPDLFPGR